MAKIQISTEKARAALASLEASDPTVNSVKLGKGTLTVFEGKSVSKKFLKALLLQNLDGPKKQIIQAHLGDENARAESLHQSVDSAQKCHQVLDAFFNTEVPTLMTKIGARWYPVTVSRVTFQNRSEWAPPHLSFNFSYQICDQKIDRPVSISQHEFRADDGEKLVHKPIDLLEAHNLRPITTEEIVEWQDLLEQTNKRRDRVGHVIDMHGTVLSKNSYLWYSHLEATRIGTPSVPSFGVIESELEIERNGHGHSGYGYGVGRHHDNTAELPFLRVFALDLKKYVYVDVRDCKDHIFDTRARDRLHLPDNMRRILGQIFESPEVFGDMFAGRHGGMVLLANGPTGVGKTLTAEVFAEMTKRPLYVMEMGELGTNLADVEKSLQRVFARASRWNAVLLFDEADVFMAERTSQDLERSAIVGVFLRLLDRYAGMFFLTSNRAKVIDPAFSSRITLRLDYPEIQPEIRQRIWRDMMRAAGLMENGKPVSDKTLEAISERPLNGREIRNQVRLLKVMHPNGEIALENVQEVLELLPTKEL